MRLHLNRLAPLMDDENTVDETYFVIESATGQWSPRAKIVRVFSTPEIARAFAASQHQLHPNMHYGISVMRETREASP